MSDVREVSEWHEAMEGSLTVAGERLSDAMDALAEASGIPEAALRLIDWMAGHAVIIREKCARWFC